MERKMKLAAAISLLGLTSVACAPNPYWQYPGSQNRSTATTTRTAPQGGVTHNHCGKVHTHTLPPQGLAHHHGDGCMAGSNTTTVAPPPSNTYTYNPPVSTNPYTSSTPVNNYNAYSAPKPLETSTSGTYYYDYTGANNYTTPTGGTTNTTSSSTTTTTAPSAYAGGDTYTVQKGDTVFQVMRNTGVYWKDIIRLNNLQAPDHTIHAGQTLRLK